MRISKYSLIISHIIIVLVLFFGYITINNIWLWQGLGSGSWVGWWQWYNEYTDWYGGKARDYGGDIVKVYDKRWGVVYEWKWTITYVWSTLTVVDALWDIVYQTLWYTKECNTWLYWVCSIWIQNCNYNGCGSCIQTISASKEICDNIDNDCNNIVDDGGVCVIDECPSDPNKTSPGICWCSQVEYDPDENGICWDQRICWWTVPANYGQTCNINACGAPWWTIWCNGLCTWPTPSTPTEICDGVDNDCDGQVDEWYNIWATCNTNDQGICKWYGVVVCSVNKLSSYCNATPNPPSTETCSNSWYDSNCDGIIGNISWLNTACDNWLLWACYAQWQMTCSWGWLSCNAPIISSSIEVCGDGIDNNCDWEIDEWCTCIPWDTSTRPCGSNIWVCQQGIETRTCQSGWTRWPWWVCVWSTWPSTETCSNTWADNNCDGVIDNVPNINTTCNIGIWACSAQWQMTCNWGWFVCSATAWSPSMEICNGIDDNCDGIIDNQSGSVIAWSTCYQCNPWSTESASCGYTENKWICKIWSKTRTCQSDGNWGNYGACIGTVFPSTETCSNTWADNNCDGIVDNVSNIGNICNVGVWACSTQWQMICSWGWLVCSATAWSPSTEVCGDSIDNDCDGQTDEWCNCTPWKTNTISCWSSIWVCKPWTQSRICQSNWQRWAYGTCNWSIWSTQEICDGLDNDCDGQTDEGGVCTSTSCTPWEKMTKSCWSESSIGICRVWYQERTCQSDGSWGNYGACIGTIFPSQEICDGLDNDCDGQTDEGGVCNNCTPWDKTWVSCGATSNIWACKVWTQERLCWSDGKRINIWSCIWSVLPKAEICNRQDDDCDGQTDEEGVCIIDNCPMDPDKLNPWLCGCGRVDYDPDNNNICWDQRIKADPLSYTLSEYIPTNMPVYNNTNNYITYNPTQNNQNTTYTYNWNNASNNQSANTSSQQNNQIITQIDTTTPIIQEIIDEPIIQEIDTKNWDQNNNEDNPIQEIPIQEIIDKQIIDIESEISDLDVIDFLQYDDADYIPWEFYIQWYELNILEDLFLKLDERFHILDKKQPFLEDIWLDIWKVKFEYQKNSTIMAYISKQKEPSIDIYEPVIKYVVATQQTNEYNMTDIDMPWYLLQAWLWNLSNCMDIFNKQKIAIIDNAFDTNHEDLKDIIIDTIDIADDDDDVTPPAKTSDRYHGTVMASVAASSRSNNIWAIWSSLDTAELILIKSTTDKTNGWDITAWPEWVSAAIKLRPNIINLSWGSFKDSKTLKKIINKWIENNITIVASAGNFNKWDIFYPAGYDWVLSVWALNQDNKKATFSNYGDWISIAAPGTDINAAIFDNKYKTFDGTSEASALVAWLISYWYAHGFQLDDILDNIVRSDANVGKWYINFNNICDVASSTSVESNTTQSWSQSDDDIISDNETFAIQSNRKKTLGYIIGLLWLLLIIWAAYYTYKNINKSE